MSCETSPYTVFNEHIMPKDRSGTLAAVILIFSFFFKSGDRFPEKRTAPLETFMCFRFFHNLYLTTNLLPKRGDLKTPQKQAIEHVDTQIFKH